MLKGLMLKIMQVIIQEKKIDQLTELAKTYKAKGLAWLK